QAAVVHAKYLKREEPKATNQQPTNLDLSDSELIKKAMSAKNGHIFRALWNGDISGYPSHSEADLALCNLLAYWTNGNAHRIDALFRQSALFRPEKWDKKHGPDTYGNMTIKKALSDFSPYTPIDKKTAPTGAATPGAVKGIT